MAFLIRSEDGRVRICTASADAAQRHAAELRRSGMAVEVTDFNGAHVSLTALASLDPSFKLPRIEARKAA